MGKNKSSRGMGLRVRSESGSIRKLNAVESRVIEDPKEPFDFFFKFIVIGDENVGKTNFMFRAWGRPFTKSPKRTYGVEFCIVNIPLPNSNQRVRA